MENLGKQAEDKITGFKGVITSKHSYITGCSQYGIQPVLDKNGKLEDIKYFDENRLKIKHQVCNVNDFNTDKSDGCDTREHPSE